MAVTAPIIRPQDCKDEISFARIIDSAKQYMVIIDGKANVVQQQYIVEKVIKKNLKNKMMIQKIEYMFLKATQEQIQKYISKLSQLENEQFKIYESMNTAKPKYSGRKVASLLSSQQSNISIPFINSRGQWVKFKFEQRNQSVQSEQNDLSSNDLADRQEVYSENNMLPQLSKFEQRLIQLKNNGQPYAGLYSKIRAIHKYQ